MTYLHFSEQIKKMVDEMMTIQLSCLLSLNRWRCYFASPKFGLTAKHHIPAGVKWKNEI